MGIYFPYSISWKFLLAVFFSQKIKSITERLVVACFCWGSDGAAEYLPNSTVSFCSPKPVLLFFQILVSLLVEFFAPYEGCASILVRAAFITLDLPTWEVLQHENCQTSSKIVTFSSETGTTCLILLYLLKNEWKLGELLIFGVRSLLDLDPKWVWGGYIYITLKIIIFLSFLFPFQFSLYHAGRKYFPSGPVNIVCLIGISHF